MEVENIDTSDELYYDVAFFEEIKPKEKLSENSDKIIADNYIYNLMLDNEKLNNQMQHQLETEPDSPMTKAILASLSDRNAQKITQTNPPPNSSFYQYLLSLFEIFPNLYVYSNY